MAAAGSRLHSAGIPPLIPRGALVVFWCLLCGCRFAELRFIDVGYGDAVLVRAPAVTMLVDAGPAEAGGGLLAHLRAAGVERLDVLVITHRHPDHLGGAAHLVRHLRVGEVWVNRDVWGCPEYRCLRRAAGCGGVRWRALRRGMRWRFGELEVECLHPERPLGDPNASSIVLRLRLRGLGVLLCGDIPPEVQRELAGRFDLRADVLKVPHHGLEADPAFIAEVRPRLAVLTVGPNPYGAPDPAVLERYREAGATVLRTDRGTVVVRIDGGMDWVQR